jgi:hypothetical protein
MRTPYSTSEIQPMTKLEQLHARMQELSDIIDIKREKFFEDPEKAKPENMMIFMEELTKTEEEEYAKLSRQSRVICDAELHEWSGKGKMMTLNDFVKNVSSGGFIDYDGSGNYSDGIKESDVCIYPSDVEVGNYRKDFTHVIWYNR